MCRPRCEENPPMTTMIWNADADSCEGATESVLTLGSTNTSAAKIADRVRFSGASIPRR
jgi:hypothetical protein